ncbi:MAG: M1 family peptidase [Calditrichaeota bacterium]|nr:MAG: M1 family peptidase [Calditrichota bacterium]
MRYLWIHIIWILILFKSFSVLAQTKPPTHYVPPLSERIANYQMDVKLDVEKKLLHGREILTWRNTTSHPTTELQFHLYYNAWRNNKSSFLRSWRYNSRTPSEYGEDAWGYCEIEKMLILSFGNFPETELTDKMEYIQPDDGNPYDRTVLKVNLPRAIQPGEMIQVEIQWESKIPRPIARTGALDDYFFLAQWFPKIGVFEENGQWNCHQFIQTEFYADYGVYDVKLTVPQGWIVGATGEEIEKVNNEDGTTTHHFYQEDVHDFTWVTSPHFLEFNRLFKEEGLPPVKMRLLLMPDHQGQEERYFQSTATALKYYGLWAGPYPYGHVTIIDPAYQSRSGGMEYPTLFTGGSRWWAPPASWQPESVTIHEAGHQFWYGIVGNNEFEYAWLDEGFNTYTQNRIFTEFFPPRQYVRRYIEGLIPIVFEGVNMAGRTDGADGYFGFYSMLKNDSMSTKSYRYGPNGYRINSYGRPAMTLRTLENYLGWETFQKILSTYFDRWKFRHPKPEDFFAVVNEISGQDMSWFFDQTYYSANVFDYAVGRVQSQKIAPLSGFYEKEDSLQYYSSLEPSALNEDTTQSYLSTVYIRRWGEAIFPIEIQFTFEDSTTIQEQWDGKARWKKFQYRTSSPLVKVEVDPRNILVLDINHSNNTWVSEPQNKLAAWKWASKWMVWLQNALEFVAFF